MARRGLMKGKNSSVCLMSGMWLMASILAAESPGQGRLEIVDRSIEFHGGEIFLHSLSELQVCSKSGCYRIRARVDGGMFEIEAAGRVRDQERRVRITNETVEHWQDGSEMEVTTERSQSLRDWVMAKAYFVYLPFRLNDNSVVQQDLGIEVWKDRPLYKVKVTFVAETSSDADDEFLYWFDPDTGRLEQFAYSFAGKPGGLRFRRAFNYRRVGGLLFFDQENWGVEGEGLTVDGIHPEGIASWDLVSTVTVQEMIVRSLER